MTETRLYSNGIVHALDGEKTAAEALLVRDGYVAAVGADADLQTLAGSAAERLDLRGAALMPGFVDTHPHLLHFGAFAHPLVDLGASRVLLTVVGGRTVYDARDL